MYNYANNNILSQSTQELLLEYNEKNLNQALLALLLSVYKQKPESKSGEMPQKFKWVFSYDHIVMDYNGYEHDGYNLRSFRMQKLGLDKPLYCRKSLQV